MREYFGEEAQDYDRNFGLRRIKVKTTLVALEILDLPEGSFILDAGCGTGWSTETIRDEGYKVVGVDISEDMIKIAKEKELDVSVSDIREMDFEDEAFDGVISISVLNFVADGSKTEKEIYDNYLKAAKEKFYKGTHIEIEILNAQIEALQKNIDRLTYSEESKIPVERKKGEVEFYIPLKRIPGLNFDESRLLLQVKAKTGVVTMLITQLEQAKLDEAKDMPTINVLDWAEPPEKPIKPRIKLNLILSLLVSLFIGMLLIYFLEFINRMDQDPEISPKWQEMKQGLIKSFFFFKKSKQ